MKFAKSFKAQTGFLHFFFSREGTFFSRKNRLAKIVRHTLWVSLPEVFTGLSEIAGNKKCPDWLDIICGCIVCYCSFLLLYHRFWMNRPNQRFEKVKNDSTAFGCRPTKLGVVSLEKKSESMISGHF